MKKTRDHQRESLDTANASAQAVKERIRTLLQAVLVALERQEEQLNKMDAPT
jgi:hypothetical protein